MKRKLIIYALIAAIFAVVCFSCSKESIDNSFKMTDSWWMAKGWGGNTNYFFHFRAEDTFDFYDYGVNLQRQTSALYSTSGKMATNADGTISFSFRAADIDLEGYWKDKDLSGCGWFDDLVFTSGKWNPAKPNTKDEAASARIDVSCHSDDIIWGKVSGSGRDFETSFKLIDESTFERYREKAFEK